MLLASCNSDADDIGDVAEEMIVDESQSPIVKSEPEDIRKCKSAKTAAVSARSEYDRDYEARNPGFQSMPLSVEELTVCRLVVDGAFVGKWGGQRWRFIPTKGSGYSTDPRDVWIGENEGLDDLSWFSEWRSEGASIEKNEELNSKLKTADEING